MKNDNIHNKSSLNDDLPTNQQYLKDKRLPKANAEIEWTPEKINEITKCDKNILYFAENYFYIINLDEGKQKISLYGPQKKVLKKMSKNRFVVVCTSRQFGKTTLMTIYAMWIACFNKDQRIVIVANKEKTAINILRRIKTAYKKLPNWLKPGIDQWGITEVIFANGSSIAISTTTGSAVRGESVNLLMIDEMAYIQPHLMEDFWGSVIPAISSSKKTKIFAVSTPNGTGNKFHEIFSGSESGDLDEWAHEKVNWDEIPGRDKRWKKSMLQALNNDEVLFKQEFENEFLETGETAVDNELLNELKAKCADPLYSYENNKYKIWKAPKKDRIYAIGVDVGEGIGQAASTACVLDLTDLTNIIQVATYHNNMIDPACFAEVLNRIGNHWGQAPLLIERNNCGGEVLSLLNIVHHYPNLVSYDPTQKIRLGVYSHTNTKYTGVTNMRYWVNTLRAVTLNDIGTINEFKTFIKHPNGTWKKRKGTNIWDDRVDCLIWSLLILIDELITQYFEVISYDKNGKPLKIKKLVVENDNYLPLDPFYQKNMNAPLPNFLNINEGSQKNGVDEMTDNGWSIVAQ